MFFDIKYSIILIGRNIYKKVKSAKTITPNPFRNPLFKEKSLLYYTRLFNNLNSKMNDYREFRK